MSEFVLSDKSRVDCILDRYAVEVEWAHKWPESIGQAIYYGLQTKRLPAIVIIRKMPKDAVYCWRFESVVNYLGVTYWYIDLK